MILGAIISFLLCAVFIYLAYRIIDEKGPVLAFSLFYLCACVFGLAGLLTLFMEKDIKTEINKHSAIEYPASEFKLEYKITTIGEQIDTTYVLTKIQ